MTICNMTIEGGGRAGMVAPDDVTFDWFERGERPGAPSGAASTRRSSSWRALHSDADASFDREVVVDVAAISPQVTWGTNPGMVVGVADRVPRPEDYAAAADARRPSGRSHYMGLEAGTPIEEIRSTACSSARAPTRASATCARRPSVIRGRRVADHVQAMVVPGSAQVSAQAEAEGLDEVFSAAGFDWRKRRLLDVPGDEPRHPRARRALRLDLEPQLRGPAGTRRAHAPRLPGDGGRGGHRRPFRRHPRPGAEHGTDHDHRRSRQRPRPRDVDTDQIIPKQFLKRIERTGFGEFLFYDWAKEPGWELPRNPILDLGAQLRLRVLARACAVGARGLRLPRDRRAELRRHLLQQLRKIGLLAVRSRRPTCVRWRRPGTARSTSRRRRCALPGARCLRDRPGDRRRLLGGLDDIALTLKEDEAAIATYEAERERVGPVTTALDPRPYASRARPGAMCRG